MLSWEVEKRRELMSLVGRYQSSGIWIYMEKKLILKPCATSDFKDSSL